VVQRSRRWTRDDLVATPPVTPGRDPPTDGLMLTFGACLAVLLAALVLMYRATDGGSAFTTETLRRSEVARAPIAVPDFSVIDAGGNAQSLRTLLAQSGDRAWIVDFVYTRCQTVCLALGTTFQRLQATIVEQGLQDRVGLLSISFDPLQDGPPALTDYAKRMGMQPGVWRLVSLAHEADRRRLLERFGIMVVPAPLGEFEHNAALHLIDPATRLVHIFDLGEPGAALQAALVVRDAHVALSDR